jgi:hypothetical protein
MDRLKFEVFMICDDVTIHGRDKIGLFYSTMYEQQHGLQCDFHVGSPEYNEILGYCSEIAKNFAKIKRLCEKKS